MPIDYIPILILLILSIHVKFFSSTISLNTRRLHLFSRKSLFDKHSDVLCASASLR